MYRTRGPVLSPGTARYIIDSFAGPSGYASTSSESPDSLYSSISPVFNNEAFEYDNVESRDQEEHDAMLQGDEHVLNTPLWGQWPANPSGTAWTPSPKNEARYAVQSSGSIISISPSGSYSSSHRASTPMTRLKSGSDGGIDMDPTRLGFNLLSSQRRTSGTRRRSSVLSTGSSVSSVLGSSVERIVNLTLLGRPFNEVVEVTCPSDEDIAVARAAISGWSPDTASGTEEETDSEVHTAPYYPTPQLVPSVPAVLSNFPLSSVAVEPGVATPSDVSSAPSPIPARVVRPFVATPPPPPAPRAIIRAKTRPGFSRFVTDYQFPPRTNGVPPGAGPPRPLLARAVSTPLFSAAQTGQEMARALERRAAGTFPLARAAPLGVSPLRQSLRRPSTLSECDSRRDSLAELPPFHRDSLAELPPFHRDSISDRTHLLENLRMSAVRDRDGSIGFRLSAEAKSVLMSRKGSSASRSSASDRRSSSASRKSSVISMTDYVYLAPSIVIDAPAPATAGLFAADQSPETLTRRRNGPARISMPNCNFQATALNTPAYTPRFSRMDSFFGRTPSTPSTIRGPLTPLSEHDKTPMMPHYSPQASMTPKASASPMTQMSPMSPTTPRAKLSPTVQFNAKANTSPRTNIMDRGRPISPPQFLAALPVSPRQRLSQHSPMFASPELEGRSSGESAVAPAIGGRAATMPAPGPGPPTRTRSDIPPTRTRSDIPPTRTRSDIPSVMWGTLPAETLERPSPDRERVYASPPRARRGAIVHDHRRTTSADLPHPAPTRRAFYRRQATVPVDAVHYSVQDPQHHADPRYRHPAPAPQPQPQQQPPSHAGAYTESPTTTPQQSPAQSYHGQAPHPGPKANANANAEQAPLGPYGQPSFRGPPGHPGQMAPAHDGKTASASASASASATPGSHPMEDSKPSPSPAGKSITKRVSVTFAEQRLPIPRTSSFTRFFHGRGPKSNAGRSRSMDSAV